MATLPNRPTAAVVVGHGITSSGPSSPVYDESSRPPSPLAATAPRSTYSYPQTPDLDSYPPTAKSTPAPSRSGSHSKDPLLKRDRLASKNPLERLFNLHAPVSSRRQEEEEERGRRKLSSSQVEIGSRDSVRRLAAEQEAKKRGWISREMAQRIVGFGMIAL